MGTDPTQPVNPEPGGGADQAPPVDPAFTPAGPTTPPVAPAFTGGAPATLYAGGAGGQLVQPSSTGGQAQEQTTPEAEAAEQAAEVQAEAAHAAAAAHVATAGPIVWGDRGEVVQIAAKLLARATGQENGVSAGTAEPMWSSALADATARFQEQAGLTVPYRGCVDAATWAALEQAARSATDKESGQ